MPIEWTEKTWNPFAGCSKVSPGCKHCYAIHEAIRKHTTIPKYEGTVVSRPKPNWTGRINFDPSTLRLPHSWRRPQRVFVNSMSDLFHENVPFEWLQQVFRVMNECSQHQFQILTKRSDVLKAIAARLTWTPNIWMGVSVENADYTYRIDHLRDTPAAIKWISAEPLLGPLDDIDLSGIHWVVTGGLSGGDAPQRPQDTDLAGWVRSIREQCLRSGVAFFHKQWGGPKRLKKANGKTLDGREWMEYPTPNSNLTHATRTLNDESKNGTSLNKKTTARTFRAGPANDVVYTSPSAAMRIVSHFQPSGIMIDPCRGTGAFYDAMRKLNAGKVLWCEIAEGRDFLDFDQKVDWCITNPPWSAAAYRPISRHAFEISKNVVFLVRLQMPIASYARLNDAGEFGHRIKEIVLMTWQDAGLLARGYPLAVVHWQRGWSGGITMTDWASPLPTSHSAKLPPAAKSQVLNGQSDRVHEQNIGSDAKPQLRKAPITWKHESDEWSTPQDLFEFLNRFFRFDVDVAATKENAKCNDFWTKTDDGLTRRWEPEKNYWMNPPYSQARKWVKKANEAAAAGATVVGLLPNRSATGWYRDFVVPNAHIIQLHGRAKFIPSHRPVQNSSAPFASIIVIWPKSAASRLLHLLTPADVGVMSLSVAA